MCNFLSLAKCCSFLQLKHKNSLKISNSVYMVLTMSLCIISVDGLASIFSWLTIDHFIRFSEGIF